MTLKSLILALLGAALFSSAALAESASITMRTYSVITVIDPPPWRKSNDFMAHMEVSRRENNGTFFFEMIPKGESFENWSELYAILAMRNQRRPLKHYAELLISKYERECEDIYTLYSPNNSRKSFEFSIACSKDKSNPRYGEIAAFHLKRENSTLVSHYYHKRYKPFKLRQNAWPVNDTDTWRDIAQAVKRLELVR